MIMPTDVPRCAAVEIREPIATDVTDGNDPLAEESVLRSQSRNSGGAQAKAAQSICSVQNDPARKVPGAVDEEDLFVSGSPGWKGDQQIRQAIAVNVSGDGYTCAIERAEFASAEELDAEVAEFGTGEIGRDRPTAVDEVDGAALLEPIARDTGADEDVVEAVAVDVTRRSTESANAIAIGVTAKTIVAESAAKDESRNGSPDFCDLNLRRKIGVAIDDVDAPASR